VQQAQVAAAHVPGAVGLRDDRVQSEQQADTGDGDQHEGRPPHADGADRFRVDAADHHHVDDAHGDPADLGHDHRHGDAEHRPDLVSPCDCFQHRGCAPR